jgi:hypothetical protein
MAEVKYFGRHRNCCIRDGVIGAVPPMPFNRFDE